MEEELRSMLNLCEQQYEHWLCNQVPLLKRATNTDRHRERACMEESYTTTLLLSVLLTFSRPFFYSANYGLLIRKTAKKKEDKGASAKKKKNIKKEMKSNWMMSRCSRFLLWLLASVYDTRKALFFSFFFPCRKGSFWAGKRRSVMSDHLSSNHSDEEEKEPCRTPKPQLKQKKKGSAPLLFFYI